MEIDPTYVQSDRPTSRSARRLPGLLFAAVALLVLVLLILLPSLISVNRFQRRIAASISQSLGRPVHLDQVTLHLLPLPGFTINNLVVDEDPAFGSEPIIRANTVQATLRISSLWRRRIEFSTISFTEPSVNLVHLPSGKWNLESILLHAAHIEAAPTAQKNSGPTPRFPYIEATGARLNLKLGQEKIPLSLTDAEFALWLPQPQEWHLRLQAHPARTDTNVSDTGTLQVEGTLGRAGSLGDVPVTLQGEWRNAPLGESSRLLFGRDAGLRGQMTLSANVQGTVSKSALQARLRLTDARRADFVPDQPLNVDMECLGTATGDFHTFENLRCTWPPSGSSSIPTLAVTGDLPDVRRLRSTTLDIGTPGIPAGTLLDWLRVASSRVPAGITATGTLTGSLSWRPTTASSTHWSGEMLLADASLINPKAGRSSFVTGDISLQSASSTTPPAPRGKLHFVSLSPPGKGFQLASTALALGGKDPAILDGHFDSTGYTLHLTGMASTARLLALGSTIPQFGDGLAAALPVNRAAGPFRIDLTATRLWGGAQLWTDNTVHPAPVHPRHPRHE
jgi:AsmA family